MSKLLTSVTLAVVLPLMPLLCGCNCPPQQCAYSYGMIPFNGDSRHDFPQEQKSLPVGIFECRDGVKFQMPDKREAGKFDIWSGLNNKDGAQEGGTHTATITFRKPPSHVTKVYTVLNTDCGNATQSLLKIRFCFKDGQIEKVHEVELTGNVDVRDHFYNREANDGRGWTQNVRAPTAQIWSDEKPYPDGADRTRLDRQEFTIPNSVYNAVLDRVELIDTGATTNQRGLLLAVTAVSCVEIRPEGK